MPKNNFLTKKLIQSLPLTPVSESFGFDRGTPIDRYYMDLFFKKHSKSITGKVLEIAESTYTRKYGSDLTPLQMHVESVKDADYVGDLSTGIGVPISVADCFILTQTIPVIYDIHAAIENAVRTLKPGGTLLVTCPGITKISEYDYSRWGHYWSITDLTMKKLLQQHIPEQNIEISIYGNVKSATAFLYGLASSELSHKDLSYFDNNYQVLIAAKATKPLN